ncbi:aminoglycoside phosphotransferase family protein [Actinomadura kijaniata]|uniref:aminoglycoside phosphotransferase family protein n=1 Tax=Actinomadura kijaniata TaxID=46161 RepID=UPI000835B9E3|nr:aminoglycoside phosphotransferase family protein [Actinomadura kijaniata]
MRIEVPERLAEVQAETNGDAGRRWVAGLPGLAADLLERWELRPDGEPRHGWASLVVPVRRADGGAAVLKLQLVDEENAGEAAALRAWDGRGAVRLLAEDAGRGALLLERLDAARSLADLPDDREALTVLTGLLARLVAAPAPPGMRTLADVAREMLADAPELLPALRGADRRLADVCVGAVRELADEAGDRLLHWDLHYENVLSADREPWLAIDPKPLAGDPGFDLLPALRNRWDDLVAAGDVTRALRWRFDHMTEVLGLDRRRAAGWTLGRVLQNVLWDLEDDEEHVDDVQRAVAECLEPLWT